MQLKPNNHLTPLTQSDDLMMGDFDRMQQPVDFVPPEFDKLEQFRWSIARS